MRELRLYGSVRGAAGNSRPYRDKCFTGRRRTARALDLGAAAPPSCWGNTTKRPRPLTSGVKESAAVRRTLAPVVPCPQFNTSILRSLTTCSSFSAAPLGWRSPQGAYSCLVCRSSLAAFRQARTARLLADILLGSLYRLHPPHGDRLKMRQPSSCGLRLH